MGFGRAMDRVLLLRQSARWRGWYLALIERALHLKKFRGRIKVGVVSDEPVAGIPHRYTV